MTTTPSLKAVIRSKLGKRKWSEEPPELLNKMRYHKGIALFDAFIEQKKISKKNVKINVDKYPKGVLFKLHTGFLGLRILRFPIAQCDFQNIELLYDKEDGGELLLTLKTGERVVCFIHPGKASIVRKFFYEYSNTKPQHSFIASERKPSKTISSGIDIDFEGIWQNHNLIGLIFLIGGLAGTLITLITFYHEGGFIVFIGAIVYGIYRLRKAAE